MKRRSALSCPRTMLMSGKLLDPLALNVEVLCRGTAAAFYYATIHNLRISRCDQLNAPDTVRMRIICARRIARAGVTWAWYKCELVITSAGWCLVNRRDRESSGGAKRTSSRWIQQWSVTFARSPSDETRISSTREGKSGTSLASCKFSPQKF